MTWSAAAGEGRGGHMGKINVAVNIDRFRIEHVIKGQRLILPLPLLRDWNSATRL